MPKPIILAVDDDAAILDAVERDLGARYGDEYRVVTATSPDEGLETLRELCLENQPVALLLVDLQIPDNGGYRFLHQAKDLAPDARRVALAAFTQDNEAVEAIDRAAVHDTCTKPWEPPDERVYPILDDLLADWRAAYAPAEEVIRLVGHRWSPDDSALRDFLARNQLPYRWVDVDVEGNRAGGEAGELMAALGVDERALPLVIFPDGTHLSKPSLLGLAEKAGLQTEPTQPFYDFVIVGGGPAGLAAAVYASSEGLRTLVVEREAPGGQAGQSSHIENYLGFPSGLTGQELSRRAIIQATRFGTEILTPVEVECIRLNGRYKVVRLTDGTELTCEALLIASGMQYRRLDIAGCSDLLGAGVYYGAAMTESMCVVNSDAYIIGGGNSAGQAAVFLSRHASRVTLVVRGSGLEESMSQYLVERIEASDKISVLPHTEVVSAHGELHGPDGEQRLSSITLRDRKTGAEETVEAAGLFIFVGAAPRTGWLGDLLLRDENGYILTGPDVIRTPANDRSDGSTWPLERQPYWLETNAPGVFAAGDVRSRSVKRVASAVGEGAMCVQFVHEYLASG